MPLGRTQRIALAVAATAAGTAGLAALGAWTVEHRDTDRADPTAGVTAAFLAADDAGAPDLVLTEVAAASGVRFRHAAGERRRLLPEDTGSGLAWGDVDGDGDLDLYAVDLAGPNRLWANLGGGRFREVTAAGGAADPQGFGMGAAFADFDGDGDLDLHVTNRGANRLFANRGDGTFTDVAAAAGVDGEGWSTGAAWGDFDRDGRLDLYVVDYVAFDDAAAAGRPAARGHGAGRWSEVPYTLNPNAFDPLPNRLYRNLGGGRFEEMALPAGVSDPAGRGLAATACDLDGDGWLDLYVGNDVSPNALFRNLGGEGLAGVFEDLAPATGTADPRGSMGISVADLDLDGTGPDGLPDLFVTHWVAQENALYQALRGPGGRLEYRDRSRQAALAEVSLDRVGWGAAWADLDLDGRPDLAVANGSTLERADDPRRLRAEPPFVLWNAGGRFVDRAAAIGGAAAKAWNGRGLAAADYDADGDVDLAMSTNRGPLLLLRNDTPTPYRSLTVRLAGPPAAVHGARIEIEAAGRRQSRWTGCDVSYLSGHAPDAVFGLGDAAGAERLTVYWADGEVTRAGAAAAGRRTVTHPSAAATP